MEVLHNEKADLQAKIEKMFAFSKTSEKAKIYVDDIKSKKEFIVSFRWEGTQEEFNEAIIAAREGKI